MDYMISSHGGRNITTPTFKLPVNVTVKFFVADGENLSNTHTDEPNAWGIYNHLIPGLNLPGNQDYISQRVIESVSPGESVYDYLSWNMQDIGLQNYSGVYQVGVSRSINNLQTPTTLSKIISSLGVINSPTTIYWVACRSIM